MGISAFKAFLWALLVNTALISAALAEGVDYGALKPEHFEKLENGYQFSDETGSYKVEKSDRKRGVFIAVNENGKQRWRRHGAFYTYSSDGSLYELTHYAYGKKEGLHESYNKKGIVTFRYYYADNRRHGSYEQFNSKGQKVTEVNYVSGKKEGIERSYYNEKITFQRNYKNGKLNGEVLQYGTRSGQNVVVARSQYENGKKIGKTQWL